MTAQTQKGRRLVRCAACGVWYLAGRSSSRYCSGRCKRIGGLVGSCVVLGSAVVSGTPSIARLGALWRVRAGLRGALAGGELPGPRQKAETLDGAPRPRSWCAVCGTETTPAKRAGRPRVVCGRSECGRFRQRLLELQKLVDGVLTDAPEGAGVECRLRALGLLADEACAEIGKGSR